MQVKFTMKDEWHVISFFGEIDHHTAKTAAQQANNYFEDNMPICLCFDMGGVGFMDSSGIALILGFARRMKSIDGKLRVSGLRSQPKKVLQASGLKNFVEITEDEGKSCEKAK